MSRLISDFFFECRNFSNFLGILIIARNVGLCLGPSLLPYMSHITRKPVLPYANNKGTYQPVHPRSLISTFVTRCIDSIISLVSISEISSLYIASVAAQAGLSLPWSQTPKTGFLVMGLIHEPHHAKTCLQGFSTR